MPTSLPPGYLCTAWIYPARISRHHLVRQVGLVTWKQMQLGAPLGLGTLQVGQNSASAVSAMQTQQLLLIDQCMLHAR